MRERRYELKVFHGDEADSERVEAAFATALDRLMIELQAQGVVDPLIHSTRTFEGEAQK